MGVKKKKIRGLGMIQEGWVGGEVGDLEGKWRRVRLGIKGRGRFQRGGGGGYMGVK